MAGTSWPALVAGARARASDVEAKFDWLEGNIVPMSGGTATDSAYDLGTSAARWRSGYLSTRLNVPAIGLSDTSFISFDSTGTITANKPMKMTNGVAVNEFSIDGNMAGDSDLAVPTEKAVKTYVDIQLGHPPRVHAKLKSDTTIPDVLRQVIEFSETSDLYNEFSTGTFMAASNGTYHVHIYMHGAVSVTNSLGSMWASNIWCDVNNVGMTTTTQIQSDGGTLFGGSAYNRMSMQCDFYLSLTAGDYFNIYGNSDGLTSPTWYILVPAYDLYGDTVTASWQGSGSYLVIRKIQ
jgi:hypothetical protein